MNQFIVWTALAAEGMGANLQHYQPGITPYVREKYDVPAEWTLKAQLVCGMPVGEQAVVDAKGKAKTGLEGAVRVFGA
jgi:predicted oxidoreductase (fatty acid repression mutant protein)